MSESPISLRDETGIERFRGTQSPGGGSSPHTRQQVTGDPVTIAGGNAATLTWDIDAGPDALLDLTDPVNPAVIAPGVYAVFVNPQVTAGLGAGGSFLVTLALDANADQSAQFPAGSGFTHDNAQVPLVSVMGCYYLPAGAVINVNINNFDGVASHDFQLSAVVQRLS